jgi:hypothetical protein
MQTERLTHGDQWQIIDAVIMTFLTEYACFLLTACDDIRTLPALSRSKSLSRVEHDTSRLLHKFSLFSIVNAKCLAHVSMTVIESPHGYGTKTEF